MKKNILFLVILILSVSFTSCKNEDPSSTPTGTDSSLVGENIIWASCADENCDAGYGTGAENEGWKIKSDGNVDLYSAVMSSWNDITAYTYNRALFIFEYMNQNKFKINDTDGNYINEGTYTLTTIGSKTILSLTVTNGINAGNIAYYLKLTN